MRVVVVTPPEPIVTFDDAALHLRLGSDQTDQTYVEGLIAAATAHIDGPDGWLGRSLGAQTLEARFSAFPHFYRGRSPYWPGPELHLPYGPVIELVSSQYLDSTSQLVDVDLTALEQLGDEIAPVASDFPWAQSAWHREGVRVRYTAGSPTNVLATAKAAILLIVGDLYKNRGEALINLRATTVVMSTTVVNLLSPLRIFT